LAQTQHIEVDIRGFDLHDQQSCPQALPSRHVLAGREHEPTWRLHRPQAQVGAHPRAPGAVPLGTEQSIRHPLQPLHVRRRPGGREVVDHQ